MVAKECEATRLDFKPLECEGFFICAIVAKMGYIVRVGCAVDAWLKLLMVLDREVPQV